MLRKNMDFYEFINSTAIRCKPLLLTFRLIKVISFPRTEEDRLQKRQTKESCSSKGWNLWVLHVSHLCCQLCCYSSTGNHDKLSKRHFKFWKKFQKKTLSLSTKGWMNALVSDFYYCFLAPILILYANPTVWKSIRSIQRTIEHHSLRLWFNNVDI